MILDVWRSHIEEENLKQQEVIISIYGINRVIKMVKIVDGTIYNTTLIYAIAL